ncbi:hypothetical protein [Pseudoroseomonas cervicalis]|uniref:hypothetical protein n=1 Tax=Teichococcus cervicalis TaxID=204525 RepID=UPI0027858C9A|nr:hypothetical protein [Pseudoroseomonas cervicalis]MDQ1081445.1 hypothetical protein [Pseudoroseomonas cervicalis]
MDSLIIVRPFRGRFRRFEPGTAKEPNAITVEEVGSEAAAAQLLKAGYLAEPSKPAEKRAATAAAVAAEPAATPST